MQGERAESEKQTDYYSDLKDLFPALQKYKSEHNTANLQKLCAEIKAFCKAVYASTENEEERNVCLLMLTTFD